MKLKIFAKTDNNLYAKNRHKAIETDYNRRLTFNALHLSSEAFKLKLLVLLKAPIG
ncbi:hypothetical protein D1BOALGB6SA_700 [Olavius sp. associated proteobacterium Delta 1]|nr:hypothetical protein D1BOALGB6SA_700 [Olavius sp. associated proteobacterium Delta 1]